VKKERKKKITEKERPQKCDQIIKNFVFIFSLWSLFAATIAVNENPPNNKSMGKKEKKKKRRIARSAAPSQHRKQK
jgi:hypothetical protein